MKKKSRYEFVDDNPQKSGVLIVKEFRVIDNTCEQYVDEMDGTWKFENNNLTATINAETNTPTFFQLKDETLKIGYYVNESDPQFTPCDGGNKGSHYCTGFKNIKTKPFLLLSYITQTDHSPNGPI